MAADHRPRPGPVDPAAVTTEPVTARDIAEFLARRTRLHSSALGGDPADPADRVEFLADTADLVTPITGQHPRTDPTEQARDIAGHARAAATGPTTHPGRARKPDPMSTSTPLSSRPETRCAAPGCTATLTRGGRGRPALYCSPACRTAAHRQHRRHRDPPLTVEVDHGSTSAKARSAGRVWLVRLRRGERATIIATGLGRPAAQHLAHQINQLLHPQPLLGYPTPDDEHHTPRTRRPRDTPKTRYT